MSKSLGNFTNLLDLVDEHDPRSYRLLVLQAHYRSPVEVDRADGRQRRGRPRSSGCVGPPVSGPAGGRPGPGRARGVPDGDGRRPRHARCHGPGVRPGHRGEPDARRRRSGCGGTASSRRGGRSSAALGLEVSAAVDDVPDDIASLARRRDEARASKDWAQADALRDELHRGGLVGRGLGSGHGRPSALIPAGRSAAVADRHRAQSWSGVRASASGPSTAGACWSSGR